MMTRDPEEDIIRAHLNTAEKYEGTSFNENRSYS
jgi:hypothetical protein